MSEFDEAIGEMFGEAREVLGEVPVTFDGMADPVSVSWNALGRNEELEINGRVVSFSVVCEAAVSLFSTPPRVGQLVTRDGKAYRINGEVQSDALTYRFALESRHK